MRLKSCLLIGLTLTLAQGRTPVRAAESAQLQGLDEALAAPIPRSSESPYSSSPSTEAPPQQVIEDNDTPAPRDSRIKISPAPIESEDSYPHVTELETYILGTTYVKDTLANRLARMEKKAFGAPSTKPDLSDRTDALTAYAEKKWGKKTPVAPDDDSDLSSNGSTTGGGTSSGDADDSGPQSAYPHITTLEKEILGQAYPKDTLTARISRMESTAFGAPSKDPDLTTRTDKLDDFAQKKLHKPSFDKQQAEQAEKEGYQTAMGGPAGGAGGGGSSGGAGGANRGKQILGFLGNQLLGMAIPVPGLANTFTGMRAVPQGTYQQNTPAPDSPKKEEDPAVFEKTPPPPNARMITQVGWCEMQVFGHTSSQLHLGERLTQLNNELNYAPNQKGAELMDDMPKLLKAAQAHKP